MVNDMTAKDRLQAVEAALRERGAVDVKFFFEQTNKPVTAVVEEVADVLEAVVANRYELAVPVGDTVRPA